MTERKAQEQQSQEVMIESDGMTPQLGLHTAWST